MLTPLVSSLTNPIPALVPAAWYQSGVGVTGTLTASNWADQSGNGRDFAQGTAGNQTIYLPYSGSPYAWLPGVAGNLFQTSDAAGNRFAGDVDFRVKAALDSWTAVQQTLVSKDSGGADRGFILYLNAGSVIFVFSTDGTNLKTATSSAAVSFTAASTNWIRVTLASATGKVNFYTSSDGSTWSALGTEQTVAAGAIFDSTHTVEVGSFQGGTWPMTGKVYEVALYRGIAGTLACNLLPSTFAETSTNGATAVASTGETWTLNSTGSKPAQVVKSASLLANGTASLMATAGFTFNGASTIYVVGKANAWASASYLLDGVNVNTLALGQFNATPSVDFIGPIASNSDLALGTKGIITAVENGASSSITINAGTPVTGNHTTGDKGGLTLFTYGGNASAGANNGQWQVWEIIAFPAAHTAAQMASVQQWLNYVHHVY